MDIPKKTFLAAISLIAASSTLNAQSYIASGTILASTPTSIAQGDSFTLQFNLDASSPLQFGTPTMSLYTAGAKDIIFNFNNGTYIATASFAEVFLTNNTYNITSKLYTDAFSLTTPFGGEINFPYLEGWELNNTGGNGFLSFSDYTAQALNTALLSDLQGFSGFELPGHFQLNLKNDLGGYGVILGQITSISPTGSLPVSAVPEPSTYGLMGAAGLLGLGALRRLRKRRKVA